MGFYEQGLIVTDRIKICKRYILNGLLSDSLAIIPLCLSLDNGNINKNWKIINFLILLKLKNIDGLIEKYNEILI
jgi:hypothetical protein